MTAEDEKPIADDDSQPSRREEEFGWLQTEDDDVKTGPRGLILASGILIFAVMFGGLGWYFLTADPSANRVAGGDVPLIEAPDGPIRIEPDDPGGMEIEHQDRLVFDAINGEEPSTESQIGDRPEEPMDRPEADNAVAVDLSMVDDQAASAERPSESPASNEAEITEPAPATAEPARVEPEAGEFDIGEPEDRPLTEFFRVQLAAFGTESQAATGWERLLDQYGPVLSPYEPSYETTTLNDGRSIVRLRVGPFDTRTEADTACRSFQSSGLDCLVIAPAS